MEATPSQSTVKELTPGEKDEYRVTAEPVMFYEHKDVIATFGNSNNEDMFSTLIAKLKEGISVCFEAK